MNKGKKERQTEKQILNYGEQTDGDPGWGICCWGAALSPVGYVAAFLGSRVSVTSCPPGVTTKMFSDVPNVPGGRARVQQNTPGWETPLYIIISTFSFELQVLKKSKCKFL